MILKDSVEFVTPHYCNCHDAIEDYPSISFLGGYRFAFRLGNSVIILERNWHIVVSYVYVLNAILFDM